MAKQVKIQVKVTRLSNGKLWRRYQRALLIDGEALPDADRNWPSYEDARSAAETEGYEVLD